MAEPEAEGEGAFARPHIPAPGRPVRGSQSGRPIMAALDLLSRRWLLRVLWELRDGPCGFRQLQARCEQMSPNTLSTRLGELHEAGIAAHDADGQWILTPLGQKLAPVLGALNAWSADWARELEARTPDPATQEQSAGSPSAADD